MTKREEAINFCLQMLKELVRASDDDIHGWCRKNDSISEAGAELKMIDGAMATVGGIKKIGVSHELYIHIRGGE